jgi:hypothetical protein
LPSINTLIKDIYGVIKEDKEWFTPSRLADFSTSLSKALNQSERVPGLRLSQMGECCPCQLWHSVHSPLDAEPIQPWVHIKFTYGHILEALVIELAKAAGHEVTGEQDEVSVDGVLGHRDCIIDGCLVDVKSANSLSFQKIRDGKLSDDYFLRRYLDQLDGYLVGSANDDNLRVKDRGYILAIDKTLGHLHLHEHRHTIDRNNGIRDRIRQAKEIVGLLSPPACTCQSIPDGKSGNYKLDVPASYNPYKFCCKPQLRCFLYAGGPVYLTKVVRRPMRSDGSLIPEVDKTGKFIV